VELGRWPISTEGGPVIGNFGCGVLAEEQSFRGGKNNCKSGRYRTKNGGGETVLRFASAGVEKCPLDVIEGC